MSITIDSTVDIINFALDDLGVTNIHQVTSPQTKDEKVSLRHYELWRRELLRMCKPSFATKREKLSKSADALAFGEEALYEKPYDYLNLNSYHSDKGWRDAVFKRDYKIEGKYIVMMTDFFNQDSLNIRYTYDCTNVKLFDAVFINLMRYALGYSLCDFYKRSNTETKVREDRLEDKIKQFMAVDGQESPLKVVKRSNLIKNRQLASRDPRWY